MIHNNKIFQILHMPHISEKTSIVIEQNNTIVIKVASNATKAAVKIAIIKLFEVQVRKVRILIIKGKTKRHGKRIGHRCNWKKAYVSLEKGQNLDFIKTAE